MKASNVRATLHGTCLILLLSFAACDYQGPVEPDVILSNGSVSARLNGSTWRADLAISVLNTPPTAIIPGRIVLVALDRSHLSLGFSVAYTGLGSYTVGVNNFNNSFTAFYVLQGAESWSASQTQSGSSGTIEFTVLTANRATGSFSFVAVPAAGTGATGTKVVTNGVFDVTF